MTIYGVDLSDFNAVTTAQVGKFRAAGISFLTHKSVETSPGGNVRHVKMKAVLEAAKAGGVPFLGAYMVPRTGLSAATQGQAHIAYLDAQVPWWRTFPGFFHQVDLEVWSYDAVAASVGNDIFDWLKANGAGKPVALYASKGQYPSASMRTPRWNANYPGASVADFKAKYAAVGGDSGPGWTTYGNPSVLPLLWQYCDNAVVAGSPPIDCNAYRGTEAQFAAALGFGEVTTQGDDELSQEASDIIVWNIKGWLLEDLVLARSNAVKVDALTALVTALAHTGGVDAAELAAISATVKEATAQANAEIVRGVVAGVVANLPAGALTPAQVQSAVSAALQSTSLHFTPAS